MSFLSDRDTYKDNPAAYKLYHWPTTAETAVELASGTTAGMPAGMVVSENGRARVLEGRRAPVVRLLEAGGARARGGRA